MDISFKYLVFDDSDEPIRRFATKHEAESYVLHRPNHRIEKLPPVPLENLLGFIDWKTIILRKLNVRTRQEKFYEYD